MARRGGDLHGPAAPARTPYTPLAADRADGAAAAKRLGCAGDRAVDCLRKLSAAELVPLNEEFSDHLAYGTPLLPKDPAEAVRAGDFAKVPVVSGGTRDEARSFIGGATKAAPNAVTAKTYPRAAAHRVRTARGRDPTGLSALAVRRLRGPRLVVGLDGRRLATGDHTFDVTSPWDGRTVLHTAAQRQLPERMVASWTSCARTGRPAAPGTPWSAALAPHGRAPALAPCGVAPVDTGAEHHCSLWADVTG
ncbi:hypothetical protein [Streptomyces tremellae]|uniref:hypothetical protein n=1 Tax=Streptomyces tremellae TaxID=1124239 RepID=UPI0031E52D09